MYVKRLLDTPFGVTIISIVLGLGLATLFRKVCSDKNCIVFNGPVLTHTHDKTFKFEEACYQYTMEPVKCDTNKKIVDIQSSVETENFGESRKTESFGFKIGELL